MKARKSHFAEQKQSKNRQTALLRSLRCNRNSRIQVLWCLCSLNSCSYYKRHSNILRCDATFSVFCREEVKSNLLLQQIYFGHNYNESGPSNCKPLNISAAANGQENQSEQQKRVTGRHRASISSLTVTDPEKQQLLMDTKTMTDPRWKRGGPGSEVGVHRC